MSQIVPKPVQLSHRDFRQGRKRVRRRRHRWRARVRRSLLALAIAVPVLAGISLLALLPALNAKGHLERGRTALAKAQSLLLKGDLGAAGDAFGQAEREFHAAASDANSPLVSVPSYIPFLGRTPDAMRALADIGVRISTAGGDVTAEIAALPGGLEALAPHDGRIPLETLQQLAPGMHRAREAFEVANDEAHAIASTFVPGSVVEAGDLVRERLEQGLPLVRAADELIAAMPEFAGADGPKRYFLAAQNTTELRGTGGLISSYAILTIDHGEISVGDFQEIRSLENLTADQAPWPSEELRTLYASHDAAGFWRSTNFTPDAPTAATFIENLWKETQGSELDGTIFVDVQTLSYLLRATGPVEMPDLGLTLTQRNVVDFVANGAYELNIDDEARQELLGVVGQLIFDRFLQKASGDVALRSLVEAAADGHLIVHASDSGLEEAFRQAGAAGSFGPPPGADFFSAITNQTAGNKVDFYISQRVNYGVTLGADGTATARATVAWQNDAPAGAEPSYVLGPFEGRQLAGLKLKPGEDYQRTFVYCGYGCELRTAARNGDEFHPEAYTERGLSLFASWNRIPPQKTLTQDLELDLPRAWQGDNASGTYVLRLQGQPYIRPVTASVSIQSPPGTHITWAGEGVQVRGDTATWSGEVGRSTDIEIRFSKGFLGRVWTRIQDLLSKPVIKL